VAKKCRNFNMPRRDAWLIIKQQAGSVVILGIWFALAVLAMVWATARMRI
jgi:hypothetical protein